MNGKSAQLQLAEEVLTEFNKKRIQYCVLRNYEFLLGASDPVESLDTLVSEKDMFKVHELLTGMGFIRRKQQFSLKHKAYFKFTQDSKLISFDIQVGGIHWNDMPYLGEEVLQNRIGKSYFYVPSDNDTFVMLLVHSILGKRYFKKKYQEILYTIPVDEDYVLNQISRIFNPKTAKKLFILARKNQCNQINTYPLVLYFMLKKPKRFLTFSKLFFRWVVWIKPFKPAPLVSIVGPDGSGKSTMVNYLNDYLLANGRKTSIVYAGRGRGHILPISKIGREYKSREKKKDKENIRELFSKPAVPSPNEPSVPPPNHPPLDAVIKVDKRSKKNTKRKILYTFTAPVFTLDLFLRYVFEIFPKRMRKKIVITDRYCSDIILMKNVPLQFKKLLLSLFPKPTISIFLYNSPEILHQRRPEEPIKELQRQLDIFPKLKYSLAIKTTDKEQDKKKLIQFVFSKLRCDWS